MSNLLDKHLINHVVFVLDASSSMSGQRADQLIKAAAKEIEFLARRSSSNELNQETRVAIYTFADSAQCVVSERDVMRLPDIAGVYKAYGNTALVEAATLALDDAGLISQKYGDHAFLIYVLTDGEENASSYPSRSAFPGRMASLPDNVTVACLVPKGINYAGSSCVDDAVRWGFPRNNVAVWNTSDVHTATAAMSTATENFMQARATGLRSTTSLFNMGSEAVNAATVAQALTPLSTDDYALIPIIPSPASNEGRPWEIKQFAEHCGHQYTAGFSGYYELVATKKKPSEVIQGNKKIIVVDKATNQAYAGSEARGLIGLGTETKRVRPGDNPGYKVYVLSGSVNRHLVPGTHLLIKKR